jgi:cephalosporin hydroxylase
MNLKKLLKDNDNYKSRCSKGFQIVDFCGTDKEHVHHYVSSFYEDNFLKFKNKKINLLEIGVQFGGSLYLWNDYFQKGNIYGVDVVDLTDGVIHSFNRIKIFLNDAYDAKFANSLPDFDIVIDDGPHTLDSFIKCIDLYLPKIKSGGFLIIEDIPDMRYAEELYNYTKNYKKYIIDTREKYRKYDNIMFVVSKENSDETGRENLHR